MEKLRGAASLGRRFSYCLVPHSVNISSALNFGALANVTVPGAASTPLVAGDVEMYHTMVLDSIEVGNKTVASVASSRIVVDSGTTLTFLDPALMGPLVDELSHRCSRRTGCCSCATSCPGGRWKPERESQITSINISRSPDTPSWNLVQIITVLM
uniref:Peptidase A1 domain-containing protein n=1 Tax=Oryza rufipogon TaxID=4529 RepID=A0A0E0Q7C5_ORYRU